MRWRSIFMAAVGVWGCASGETETDPDEVTTSAKATVSTGVGGMGGAGGSGGAGGTIDLPCGMDCSAIDTPQCFVSVCNEGQHQGQIGACVVVPDVDGRPCDDALFCTIDDTCQAGVCTGGPTNDCGMGAPECEEVACDEAAMACTTQPVNDGMACVGNNLCIVGGTCQNGQCAGGDYNECFFAPTPDDCHVAVCNPLNGMCEPVVGNEGEDCTDPNDLCTVGKICSAGTCIGGGPKDCSALTQNCNLGVCDVANGLCTTQTVMDGQLCDDLNACTSGETCSMGNCGNGTPVTSCSQVADGCCPSTCDATNDYDCACPGVFINGTCVYLASTTSYTFAAAQSICQGLGTGWDLCPVTLVCDTQTLTYLGSAGCSCVSGQACACASGPNTYVHLLGGQSPYYIRHPAIAGCTSTTCTVSVSATCGTPLCCKP